MIDIFGVMSDFNAKVDSIRFRCNKEDFEKTFNDVTNIFAASILKTSIMDKPCEIKYIRAKDLDDYTLYDPEPEDVIIIFNHKEFKDYFGREKTSDVHDTVNLLNSIFKMCSAGISFSYIKASSDGNLYFILD
jgi:hypothetical protein